MRRALKAAIALIIALAVFLLVHTFVFHTSRVEGSSMEATLRSGDVVLVTRFDYRFGHTPARGDIVECRFPGRSGVYIKRVIGLPGDEVVYQDGHGYINGAALSEPNATGPFEDYSAVLGEDEYLVLGDNRGESYDSRAEDMGFLSADCFLGRVRCVLWPFRWIE